MAPPPDLPPWTRSEPCLIWPAEGKEGPTRFVAGCGPGSDQRARDHSPTDRGDAPLGPDGWKPTSFSLLLYSREKKALGRNYINTFIWKPALKRAGVPVTRENGSHALRDFYACTALHEGESIKALSEYLGHADPGSTLRTYTHMVEDSAEHEARRRCGVRPRDTADGSRRRVAAGRRRGDGCRGRGRGGRR